MKTYFRPVKSAMQFVSPDGMKALSSSLESVFVLCWQGLRKEFFLAVMV
jgi:hypothetical protein